MTRESNGGTTVYTVSIELLDVEQAVALRKHAGVLARPQQDPHSLDTPTGLPGDLDHRARTSSTSTATLSKLFEGWASTVPPASSTPLNPQAVEFDPSHQTRRPSHKHRFSTTIKPPFEPFRRLDWRFGRLQVDMRRSASPGNMAHSVDVGFGTIRLRRKTATEQPAASGDGCTLAVLALPPIMTIADFLQFVAPAEDMIRQISILRDEDASRSMALMRFRSAPEAELFQEEFNAKPFWAMSPDEVCHVVYVASIEVRKTASVPFTFPTSTSILEEPAASSSTTQELPSCVVCLERLDSNITGLITIPCQHTFHCACLSRWASGRCPVCRYTQSIAKTEKSKRPMDEEEHQHTACDQCGGTDQLWMCLLCGHVGGGRYACRHAVSHFEQSGHLYAMETETQRVWDYVCDAIILQ